MLLLLMFRSAGEIDGDATGGKGEQNARRHELAHSSHCSQIQILIDSCLARQLLTMAGHAEPARELRACRTETLLAAVNLPAARKVTLCIDRSSAAGVSLRAGPACDLLLSSRSWWLGQPAPPAGVSTSAAPQGCKGTGYRLVGLGWAACGLGERGREGPRCRNRSRGKHLPSAGLPLPARGALRSQITDSWIVN